ncbi:MAG TPA: hypothetical protein VGL94_19220 [Ktedonobacteraceae bacterium]
MEKQPNKPTTVRFTPQDKELIEQVKELYGCPSDVAAIRLALRLVTRQEISPCAPAPQKERHSHPHS